MKPAMQKNDERDEEEETSFFLGKMEDAKKRLLGEANATGFVLRGTKNCGIAAPFPPSLRRVPVDAGITLLVHLSYFFLVDLMDLLPYT